MTIDDERVRAGKRVFVLERHKLAIYTGVVITRIPIYAMPLRTCAIIMW